MEMNLNSEILSKETSEGLEVIYFHKILSHTYTEHHPLRENHLQKTDTSP